MVWCGLISTRARSSLVSARLWSDVVSARPANHIKNKPNQALAWTPLNLKCSHRHTVLLSFRNSLKQIFIRAYIYWGSDVRVILAVTFNTVRSSIHSAGPDRLGPLSTLLLCLRAIVLSRAMFTGSSHRSSLSRIQDIYSPVTFKSTQDLGQSDI